MKHEKIFKQDDGSRVKVIVELSSISYGTTLNWSFIVLLCAPRKRTWFSPVNNNNYEYRRMSMDDRRAHEKKVYSQSVNMELVTETANELYEMLKPKFDG